MSVNEDKARLRQRIGRLTRVLEGADAERELAMYRAYQSGVSVAEIAHLALLPVDEVERGIDLCRRDPNVETASGGTYRVSSVAARSARKSGTT